VKVLIADDNSVWRELLQRHASNWGYQPVIAENGRQALDILRGEQAPRLAILDWQMPEMDGLEVCRRVKRDTSLPFTYVIMLTSRSEQEDMIAGLDAGADDYLTKPIEPAVLRSRLRSAQRIVEIVPPPEWATPRIRNYEFEELIGKGAYASVWRATHLPTSRKVAVKTLRVDLAADDVFDLFALEIQAMESMHHRYIASVYESHIDHKSGYYAMELVDGLTLERYVQKYSPKPSRLLYLTAQICVALNHAHKRGFVHRDLKPSNVLITPSDDPKLVDFGLAKSMFRPPGAAELSPSASSAVIGTPMFMAPEQARGENHQVDGRADIYALGIMLYMMLVRRHPLDIDRNDRWATIREVAIGNVRRPSEVRAGFNEQLELILMRALQERPEDRYPSASQFGKAIVRFLKSRGQRPRD
jgi:eukaryotic-like serine/threonine-protein kinase